ncbi:TPA: hypothetical protein SMF63_001726 [Serratia marcescens]|nr:hypothetical protein [Serratia marcescens]
MTLTTEQLRARAAAIRCEALSKADQGFAFQSQRLYETAAALDELAANREAQPVACDIERIKRHALPAGECPRQSQVVLLSSLRRLLTAPPAPAELTDEQIDAVLDSHGNIAYVIADKRERLRMFAREILRAAMLAQPVSSGYKLVPVEPTENMIIDGFESDAFMALADAVNEKNSWPYGCRESAECVEGIFKAMLAAAPEGGN